MKKITFILALCLLLTSCSIFNDTIFAPYVPTPKPLYVIKTKQHENIEGSWTTYDFLLLWDYGTKISFIKSTKYNYWRIELELNSFDWSFLTDLKIKTDMQIHYLKDDDPLHWVNSYPSVSITELLSFHISNELFNELLTTEKLIMEWNGHPFMLENGQIVHKPVEIPAIGIQKLKDFLRSY